MTHPPITDEMIERAARALQARNSFVPPGFVSKGAWEAYRKDARAALEAALSGKEE